MCKGFVKIPRRLFETRWWHQKRIFSESDAIIDLYQGVDKKNMMVTTLRSLADKWIWNQMKVTRFLNKLQKEGYLLIESNGTGTVITITDFGQSVTPSVTDENEKCYSETPINKGVDDSECYTQPVTSVTPSVKPRAYKNDNYISCLNENKEEPPISPKRGTPRFIKPTIEEIRSYCKEKGYNIDAEQFWNFYESKGWVVGKSPMKNWKACCFTWTKRKTTQLPIGFDLTDNSKHKYDNDLKGW